MVTWGPSPSTARNPPKTAMDASTTSTHAGPRAYSPNFRPGGRRQARRYTRWSAVVKELAKNNVSTRPRMPVALRMSSAEAKASFAVASAAPPIPSRCVRVEKIEVRTRCGANEATTITSGKNETNAFQPARRCDRRTRSRACGPTPARAVFARPVGERPSRDGGLPRPADAVACVTSSWDDPVRRAADALSPNDTEPRPEVASGG